MSSESLGWFLIPLSRLRDLPLVFVSPDRIIYIQVLPALVTVEVFVCNPVQGDLIIS